MSGATWGVSYLIAASFGCTALPPQAALLPELKVKRRYHHAGSVG